MNLARRASIGVVVLLAAAAPAVAQMFVATGRDALRGLPGVEVVVEPLPPEAAREGLEGAALRRLVVARLEAAGVVVYPSQDANPSPAKPYLYVHLNALALPDGAVYAVALQLQVRQTVASLASESRIVDAVTWDQHNVFGVPAGGFAALADELGSWVDAFVADWRAVH